jgi:hypothetical protein
MDQVAIFPLVMSMIRLRLHQSNPTTLWLSIAGLVSPISSSRYQHDPHQVSSVARSPHAEVPPGD